MKERMADKGRREGAQSYGEENARRYDEGVRENARGGKSAEQAREAARALDGPEGEKLRRAEREGKAAQSAPRH